MGRQISVARSRAKLPERREPYWHTITRGRQIGVRKFLGSEHWFARIRFGKKYERKPLKGVTSWDEALEAANKFFNTISKAGKPNGETVLDLFDDYVAKVKPSPTHGTVRKTLEAELGLIKLTELERQHIKSWRSSDSLLRHKGKTRSNATINRMITVLRAALNHGVQEEKLSDTSWRHEFKRHDEKNTARDLYLDPAQRQKLIGCATPESKPFIHLLSIIPLRPGDWHETTVKHFDKRARTLHVWSKKHERDVNLSAVAYELLVKQAEDKPENALLFQRENGKAWDRQSWNSAIKQAAKLAGLPDSTCAYTLRHSVITELCTSGLDINSIAKISGTSVEMIETHYAKLLKNIATEALDRIAF